MIYYTLSALGHQWAEDEAPNPSKYRSVLGALAELVTHNDVPRTISQISHLLDASIEKVEKGINFLIEKGYIIEAKPKLETHDRRRLPTIEELAEVEARHQVNQKKYFEGENGQAALDRYWKEGKGVLVAKKYRESEKGRMAQKLYRLRRRLQDYEICLEEHPERLGALKSSIEIAKKKVTEAEAEAAAERTEEANE